MERVRKRCDEGEVYVLILKKSGRAQGWTQKDGHGLVTVLKS
jgi:hypothetical protein